MSDAKRDLKIIVGVDYDENLQIKEILDIVKEYISLDRVITHCVDNSKYYVNLKAMDDDTWQDFIKEWNNVSTRSRYIIYKYEDWRLCALPTGWDN